MSGISDRISHLVEFEVAMTVRVETERNKRALTVADKVASGADDLVGLAVRRAVHEAVLANWVYSSRACDVVETMI